MDRQLSLRCLLQAIDLTRLHLVKNALMWRKSILATNLARVFSSLHNVAMFRCMSDFHLRDVGDETTTETLRPPLESRSPALGSAKLFITVLNKALSASHLVNSELLLDERYGSVLGIIQQVASQTLWRQVNTTTSSVDDPSSVE